MRNYFTSKGARMLAETIERYWAMRGYKVNCSIVPVWRDDVAAGEYAVRSDMINGYPRNWRKP